MRAMKGIFPAACMILLAFFFLLGSAECSEQSRGAVSSEQPAEKEPINSPEDKKAAELIVYYFHGDKRCKTCLTIEKNAMQALEEGFPDALKHGIIEWRAVNTDKKENEHFEEDFDLAFSSVIIVKHNEGERIEWKNLSRMWELVWKEEELKKYIQKEVRTYME